MELSQGQIIQKPNKQELSSFFMAYHFNVMHTPIKFHKYIPYGLGVMAQTRFTILFVCVEVLRPSQPNGVMSSAVSLPYHTFTGQA